MITFNIQYYIDLLESSKDDPISNLELNKFVDEIYSGSKYSRLFGQFIFCKLIFSNINYNCINTLYNKKLMEIYIPYFKDIHLIPQDKKYGKNLLEHTLLCYTSVLDISMLFNIKGLNSNIFNLDYNDVLKIMYFSALLHDIGKIDDIREHCLIGYGISKEISKYFSPFVDVIGFETIVPIIVKNHMRPFGIQRGEYWSDHAIKKFIIDCNDKTTAMLTVILSAVDKYASTKNVIFIEPLIKLFLRIYKI